MKTKKKLLISVLLAAFVVISVVSIIAIVFAATQQTVKTTLNINYKAEDIDAKVSATMMYQDGYSENLGSITFTAGNAIEQTGSLSPENNVELTTGNQYVIFQYTFENTGDKDFVAVFDYTDTEDADKNMVFGYRGEAENYKENANAVLVNGGETKTYNVKISVDNLSRDAHLSGDMTWDMTSDIIVATPSTAQSILDSDINGETVVFGEGTYSEILHLRPSKATAAVYDDMWSEDYTIEHTGPLSDNEAYYYKRIVNDVTFAGVEDAVFTNYFAAVSANFSEGRNLGAYDAVREKDFTGISSFGGYRAILNMNNINFKGMDFSGAKGRMLMLIDNDSVGQGHLVDLNISNCSFKTNQADSGIVLLNNSNSSVLGAIHIINFKEINVENLNFKNNYISGHNQGISIWGGKNMVCISNIISNTEHNAIAIQNTTYGTSSSLVEYCGEIEVINNKISNTGDRAIRFGILKDATINISNNTFVDCADEDSLLKTEKSTNNCSFSFESNTYNGIKLNDANGSITNVSQWEYFVK